MFSAAWARGKLCRASSSTACGADFFLLQVTLYVRASSVPLPPSNCFSVEDPLPSYNPFFITMYNAGGPPVTAASFQNVTFANIIVANFSTVRHTIDGKPLPHGPPNMLFGSAACSISNVAFINVTIAGRPMLDWVHDPTAFNLSLDGLYNVSVDGKPV